MKKILYFLGSRSLWVILGILGLIALIWFIGPLIAIGDARPLVGKGIRAIICLALLAFCVAKIVFRHYRDPDGTLLCYEKLKQRKNLF